MSHRLNLFGYSFDADRPRDVLDRASDAARRHGGPALVVTANVDHIVELSRNAAFREAYRAASARTLDGMPLVWLGRSRGGRPARITGHDLLAEVIAGPALRGSRMFLVCATHEAGAAAKAMLVARGLPRTSIAYAVPPLGFERDPRASAELLARIRDHRPTHLLMGVGAPKSEIWVHRHREVLGPMVALCIGDAVSVFAGQKGRAPVLLQRAGLEWLYRFALEPRRLFRRYFVRPWSLVGLIGRDLNTGLRS